MDGGITGKGFRKNDPRINRKGRPKSFDAFRALAVEIANEVALSDGKPIIVNGKKITVAEVILRQWATSKNALLQQRFTEIAYGKIPDKLDVTSNGENPFMTMEAAELIALARKVVDGHSD